MSFLSQRVINPRPLADYIVVVDEDNDLIFDFERDLSDETLIWSDFEEGEYPINENDYFDDDSDSDSECSNCDSS